MKASGLLHEEATGNEPKLKNITISLEDAFGPFMMGIQGHTSLDGSHIELVENYTKLIAKHEFNHAVLGGYGAYLETTWMDEMITEHFALAMENGDEFTLDPDERHDAISSYIPERIVGAALIAHASGEDPLRLVDLTRHYSAVSETAKSETKAVIDRKLLKHYGDTEIITKIDAWLREKEESSETEEELTAYARELAANPRLALATVTA